jgi:tripartite-type tricarboxylate transporter receptor subunit TctC
VLDLIFSGTLLARPYIAPPNLPADRRKALRDAFAATMKDSQFLEEIQKLGLTISPTSGEEMEHIVGDAYAQPESFIAKVRKTLSD